MTKKEEKEEQSDSSTSINQHLLESTRVILSVFKNHYLTTLIWNNVKLIGRVESIAYSLSSLREKGVSKSSYPKSYHTTDVDWLIRTNYKLFKYKLRRNDALKSSTLQSLTLIGEKIFNNGGDQDDEQDIYQYILENAKEDEGRASIIRHVSYGRNAKLIKLLWKDTKKLDEVLPSAINISAYGNNPDTLKFLLEKAKERDVPLMRLDLLNVNPTIYMTLYDYRILFKETYPIFNLSTLLNCLSPSTDIKLVRHIYKINQNNNSNSNNNNNNNNSKEEEKEEKKYDESDSEKDDKEEEENNENHDNIYQNITTRKISNYEIKDYMDVLISQHLFDPNVNNQDIMEMLTIIYSIKDKKDIPPSLETIKSRLIGIPDDYKKQIVPWYPLMAAPKKTNQDKYTIDKEMLARAFWILHYYSSVFGVNRLLESNTHPFALLYALNNDNVSKYIDKYLLDGVKSIPRTVLFKSILVFGELAKVKEMEQSLTEEDVKDIRFRPLLTLNPETIVYLDEKRYMYHPGEIVFHAWITNNIQLLQAMIVGINNSKIISSHALALITQHDSIELYNQLSSISAEKTIEALTQETSDNQLSFILKHATDIVNNLKNSPKMVEHLERLYDYKIIKGVIPMACLSGDIEFLKLFNTLIRPHVRTKGKDTGVVSVVWSLPQSTQSSKGIYKNGKEVFEFLVSKKLLFKLDNDYEYVGKVANGEMFDQFLWAFEQLDQSKAPIKKLRRDELFSQVTKSAVANGNLALIKYMSSIHNVFLLESTPILVLMSKNNQLEILKYLLSKTPVPLKTTISQIRSTCKLSQSYHCLNYLNSYLEQQPQEQQKEDNINN